MARCSERLPERCEEITCEVGTECKKDGIAFAKCIPARIDADDCSTVCSDNLVCQLTGAGRPRCGEKPPPWMSYNVMKATFVYCVEKELFASRLNLQIISFKSL